MKNPVIGKVKTRLAADIGDRAALEVYLRLVKTTRAVCEEVSCTRHVFYSDNINLTDCWETDNYVKHVQRGIDLGERMINAFETVFALGAKQVVLIGTDCPDISSAIVNKAFEKLNFTDIVFGPALDGGFYLLGAKQNPTVFNGIQWSTDSVLSCSVRQCKELGLEYRLLEELGDIDTEVDLRRSRLTFPES